MDEELNGALTAEELAYFESEGESELAGIGEEARPAQEVTGQGGEQTETVQPDGETDPEKKGGTVPHGAFHAEREEHKKTKAELQAVNQRLAVLDDRWNTLLSLQSGGKQEEEAKPAEDTAPDPSADFFGYVLWQGREMQRMQERDAQLQRQSETDRAETEVWGAWDQSVAQARAARSDFDEATQYLSDLREKQLEALSLVHPQFGDPRGRAAQINAELKDIIVQSKNAGGDPADIIYQMAQKFGYSPKGAADPEPKNVQQDTLDRIAALDAAQQASRTLGASSGTNTGDPLTAEAIANMSPAEFTAWIADPKNSRLLDTLMGGGNA